MKKTGLFIAMFLLSIGFCMHAQKGETILKKMYDKYYLGPCKCYSFSQKNKHYRNDSLIKTSEWHEAVEFPDKFRITFGERNSGNKVVYRNDSLYRYKKGELVKAQRDTNSLLLFLGGMYYRSFDDVLLRVQKAGYDVNRLSEQNWKGGSVYVLGAEPNDLGRNQVWVDKKTLRVVRIIEDMGAGSMMDLRFESHQAMCKGYMETAVSFRRNGKLEQEEKYFDIKVQDKFLD